MKAVTFELSGRTAMFKKPDVNSYGYFTYNNIHKIALLGILGAICGLGGYNQQNSKLENGAGKEDEEPHYPEFYEKLKNLRVSIFPQKQGYFSKKIQVFNNSVGYASKEQGGNLIVREQWLENPQWHIYLLDDGSIDRKLFDSLADSLINNKCEFIPYLGKNEHLAEISNAGLVELEKSDLKHIDSIFPKDGAVIGRQPYDGEQQIFFFKEVAPIKLNEKYNFYEFEEFIMTNLEIINVGALEHIYKIGNTSLAFF